jgi:uncharacterized protein Usg
LQRNDLPWHAFPCPGGNFPGGNFNVRAIRVRAIRFRTNWGRGSFDMGHAVIIKDYRLTTAKIFYHLPDYPGLLQTYVWQDFDIAPEYPALRKFLDFWKDELEGKLHSVQVASARSVRSGRMRHARHMAYLH